MKILILDGITLNPGDLSWDCLTPYGQVIVYERTESEELAISRIGNSEIILTNKTPITAAILNACPNIRYIGVLATGYNVVDCNAARLLGIPVCNVPSYGTDAVAQFTFGLILELCHRIGHHNHLVHQGKWSSCPNFCFWDSPQMVLSGKTLGIIGYGRIGKAVSVLAKAFGMGVIAYSPSIPDHTVEAVDLDALLARSDIISLHCPLRPETERLINEKSISKMKDGAILINTARGQLLDELAVAQALKTGKLRGAAVDVVSQEPPEKNNPLLTAPNCILTPHMAWAAAQSRQRLLDTVVDNIRCFLDGAPQNVVNN